MHAAHNNNNSPCEEEATQEQHMAPEEGSRVAAVPFLIVVTYAPFTARLAVTQLLHLTP